MKSQDAVKTRDSVTDPSREASLRKASRDMEAVFLTQMIKAMEKTIPKGSLEESKNSLPSMMFSSVLGDAVASGGGIGLADVIYRSLLEKDHTPNPAEFENFPDVTSIPRLNITAGETDR